jgi:hypothetical protein
MGFSEKVEHFTMAQSALLIAVNDSAFDPCGASEKLFSINL